MKENVEGTVRLQFLILADGGVTNIRVLGRAVGRQLEASAIGAVSLLVYSPAKLGNCAIPAIMTYTLKYRLY